ncbi:N-acetylglucosamine-6-phosphate deacetylase [Intestinimonas butyriciproducens]|uniref:N-acetylglucosamine-6-phosphate deacetylase n=2 Tax=Intestinimonas butyriciproducens TaxID=1297617 RepID=UPI001D07A6DA|nr:N-acetylglucosamine-6-phosphate deacetylase [Intestinimonas butyriciproducens]MCB7050276.1 N-acetylglucosamine-6-phosphate deacetylase [Intestinimonas butyriciproducens]
MATICNVRIFDGTAFRKESAVTFENGTITALDDRREGEDMGGVLLCPGFVDIHMHGQKGLDSMRPGDNGRMAETQVKYGVTSFCPASITETDEAIRAYLADIRAAMELERGARVLGAYLEGPYLAERVKGAHNAAKLRDPELTHYKALTAGFEDEIRRVTLAPEKPGGMELVQYLKGRGVVASIGHSVATAAEASRAVAQGITCSTHTCNGMEPLHHRKPGVLGVTLTDDGIRAEFIADLVHIDPILIRLIYRAKGVEGCYFCTDSMEAAGMPDGNYHLGNEAITVKNGMALKGESLAGSTLTMDQGVRNLAQKVGLPLADALRMGTRNPADVLERKDLGRVAIGAKADFVLLDDGLRVCATYVRGRREYSAR